MIRILPGVYQEDSYPNEDVINNQKEAFFIHFPLAAAKRLGIVTLVWNAELPSHFKLPTKFREPITDDEGKTLYWHIVDYKIWMRKTVEVLDDVEVQYSPWGTWNDTLLIEQINDNFTLGNWK
ncbi:hypothetical protein [Paenibacillus sp. PL2-23]|uniref:hypothetical protein n=1 Tax=Paenibacillus sp. PL2-23 TaxID=2100729 RepID=UPI0030F975DF